MLFCVENLVAHLTKIKSKQLLQFVIYLIYLYCE
jgi:hypothetical protein